jgi:hypothetical protein
MNNHEGTTVLNLQRFALGSAGETMAGEESGLTVSIKRCAKALADAGSRIIAPVGVDLPPTQLLGAVSYCYAKGVYDSAEIENKMRRSRSYALPLTIIFPQLRRSGAFGD